MTAQKTATEVLASLVDAMGSADLEARAAAMAEAKAYVEAAGVDEAREVVAVPVVVVAAMLGTLASIEDATRRSADAVVKMEAALAASGQGDRLTTAPAPTHGGLWAPAPARVPAAPPAPVALPAPPLPASTVADVAAAIGGEGRQLEALAEVVLGYGPWAAGQAVRAGIPLPVRGRVLTLRPEDAAPLTVEVLDVDGVIHAPGGVVASGAYVAATLRVQSSVPQRDQPYRAHVVGVRLDAPAAVAPAPDPEAEARLTAHAAKVAAMRAEAEAKGKAGQ